MEELINFEITYESAYEPDSGKVLAVGPAGSLDHYKYTLVVDSEIALGVLNGVTPLHHCYIDFEAETLEFVVSKPVENKIDDLLHRIVEWKWTDVQDPSVIIVYNSQSQTLSFGLSTSHGGQCQDYSCDTKKKPVRWHGDTVMNFFATKYNDPHVCYDCWSFDIDALRMKNVVYEHVSLPKRFSIFTRRLFDNYVLVIE